VGFTNLPVREMSARSRWIALYVLCGGLLMIVLDMTVVNVALPSIQEDLGFSTSNLAWVVNAYLIPFGGLLLLAGRLGDLVGRRSVFLFGLTVFTGASLLCGLAQNQWILVGGRFLEGIGGALTSAVILGIIVTMFTESHERAKAIGVYSSVAAAGSAIGLLAGGILTQSINWHWIFFINLPIGVATGVLATRLIVRDTGTGFAKGVDTLGAALITSALMLAVYAIVGPGAEYGWGAGRTLILGGISLALLAAFVIREATARIPLIQLGIFRSRNISGANVIQALATSGMFGIFFLGSLYMQHVLGYSPLEIGFAFLPVAVISAVLSLRYSGRLIMRFGARATLLPNLVLIAAALILFSRAPVDGSYEIHILPVMILLGTGAGLCFPALMTLAMSDATQDDAGLVSGLINTTSQVGAALGLAVLASVSTSRSKSLLLDGKSAAAALTGGYHLAFWIGAGLVVVAIAVALTTLRSAPASPQQPAADEPEPRPQAR
jgi:EmrB/QacA subfamily drug resistance transporter